MVSKYMYLGINAVKNAGGFIKNYYNKTKDNGFNVKSNIDLEAEKIISDLIYKFFPSHSFDGEESKRIVHDSQFVWYCDAISSTKNFNRNIPFFSVCLALYQNKNPVLGIVYDPLVDEIYYAEIGYGAYLNGERISSNNVSSLNRAYFFCSPQKNRDLVINFLEKGGIFKMFGSWSLHFAYVASGKMDFAITEIKDVYGTVPGLIIAKEAGCCFFDGKMDDFSLDSEMVVVASNKELLENIKREL